MTLLEALMLFVGELLAIVLIALGFHKWGYRKGQKAGKDEGYLAGRKAADDWWFGVERDVDQARQKIWREEDAA
jgi:hypothetical protein